MLVMYGMPCWKVANCPGTDHMSRLLLDLAKDFDVAKCMGTFLVVVSGEMVKDHKVFPHIHGKDTLYALDSENQLKAARYIW